MRIHRFHCPIEISTGSLVNLPKEASHHCIQVLRYKVNSELVLFNGDGFDYHARISSISAKSCQVEILSKYQPDTESKLKIHLYQGIARGDKMDLIIQKSVELGVFQITPIFTERCNVRLTEKRLTKKQAHWQQVAISASEQSGRAIVPKINTAISIKDIQLTENASSYHLDPAATNQLADCTPNISINLFIGPEGGFSELDRQKLSNLSSQGLRIGPRILRTETAGLSCISILQSHFGDM